VLASPVELRSGGAGNEMSETTAEELEELAERDRARRVYAQEVRFAAQLGSAEVVDAFAQVARERFLGSPPWRVVTALASYWEVPGADPRDTYHNVPFAIDRARALHNGLPSFVAKLIEAAEPAVGQHVVHVGCGTGYYSAILAALVGGTGRVTAIEVDEELAERARANLAELDQVEVIHADGTRFDPGAADAILINAGATHPMPLWLERMLPGARLVLPLTVTAPLHGYGAVLRVTRVAAGLAARFISGVGIYPCSGARDEELGGRLGKAFSRGFAELARVCSLRLDEHAQDGSCWLHATDFCVSTRPTS
jgi:protein-L-isoaspartate(D-aspartate) O-methyltransferase